jgi:hypothetical protein
MVFWAAAVGLVLVGVGASGLVSRGPGLSPEIAIVGGLAIVVASLVGTRSMPRAALAIAVEPDRVVFRRVDGRAYSSPFSDRKFRIIIRDLRGLPGSGRAKGLEWVEFVVKPSFPVEAALTRTQVLTLIETLEEHGLMVTGWHDSVPAPGRWRVIRITGVGN